MSDVIPLPGSTTQNSFAVTLWVRLAQPVGQGQIDALLGVLRMDPRIEDATAELEPSAQTLAVRLTYPARLARQARETGRMALGSALVAVGVADDWAGAPGAPPEAAGAQCRRRAAQLRDRAARRIGPLAG